MLPNRCPAWMLQRGPPHRTASGTHPEPPAGAGQRGGGRGGCEREVPLALWYEAKGLKGIGEDEDQGRTLTLSMHYSIVILMLKHLIFIMSIRRKQIHAG